MRNGSTYLGSHVYRKTPIGGMGYTTGLVTASDGSWQAVKTDGAGGWRRDGYTGEWEQVFRRDNTDPSMFDRTFTDGESDGTWEFEIAPSDPNRAYASWRHRIFKSTDKAASWMLCSAVAETAMNSNAAAGTPPSHQRLAYGKLTIDPVNADVVYLGTQGTGLRRTLDGFATISTIASVPTPVSPYSRAEPQDTYCLIAIDSTSSTVSGRKSRVAVASIGNGIYLSTDGGDTFSQISATLLYPSNIQFIGSDLWVFDHITTGGVAATAPNIYKYSGGSWGAAFGPSQIVRSIAVDPTDSNILFSAPFMYRSNNGGSTWTDVAQGDGSNTLMIPHDAPMMANVFNNSQDLTGSKLTAHPSNGRIYYSKGYGITYIEASNWRAADKNTGVNKLELHEDNAGIENIVPQAALITPSGTVLMINQDKGVIKKAPTGTYPEASYHAYTLTNGYDADYAAQDPNWIAAVINKNGNFTGYSADGGDNWTAFPTSYSSKEGGCLAVIDVGHVFVVPGSNGWPQVTTDNGVTWQDPNFAGVTKITSGETGWGWGNISTDRFIVCNDKDNPLTVWAYNYGVSAQPALKGIWKSTDGGLNFTNVHNTTIIPAVSAGFHAQLRHAQGILWLTAGSIGGYYDGSADAYLYRSVDGGEEWEAMPTIYEPNYYALGKAKHGTTYPALYCIGWIGGALGLHRCTNADAATIADCTWETLPASQYFARPTALAADPAVYGHGIVGYGGMGFEEFFYDYTMRLT